MLFRRCEKMSEKEIVWFGGANIMHGGLFVSRSYFSRFKSPMFSCNQDYVFFFLCIMFYPMSRRIQRPRAIWLSNDLEYENLWWRNERSQRVSAVIAVCLERYILTIKIFLLKIISALIMKIVLQIVYISLNIRTIRKRMWFYLK